MAVHSDNHEFDQLFAAYHNRDLTAGEQTRLRELAAQDVGRRGALAEVDAVHELCDAERGLRARIMVPVEAADEADESYRRLASAAAQAEEKLRARLLHRVPGPSGVASPAGPQRSGWRWGYVLVAAALLITALVGIFYDPSPTLDRAMPDAGKVLGGHRILLTTEIRADSPNLSWSEVGGAESYEATILDAEGNVILQRASPAGRWTRWELSRTEFDRLRRHPALRLRIVARAANGAILAATPEPVPLQLR